MVRLRSPHVFLCDLTYTQEMIVSDVMPAAIASVGAYLKQELPFISLRIFKYPEKLIDVLGSMSPNEVPRVIGFSNYVWNCNLSLAFAKVIKAHFPCTTVVFGGPNLPFDAPAQERFLRDRRFIDFHVVKEGEIAFCHLVRTLYENGWDRSSVSEDRISNLVFIDNEGSFRTSPRIERVPLDRLPSPYTTGLMDEFFDGKLNPIIQTTRGCPFECTYCAGAGTHWTRIERKRRQQIDEEIMYVARKVSLLGYAGRQALHIADSNFGMYDEDVETMKTIAEAQRQFHYPQHINVATLATGKDQNERMLEAARLLGGSVNLLASAQSLDPAVLRNVKRRNGGTKHIVDLALQAKNIGASSSSEIMLALPGDTLEAHFESLRMLVEVGFNIIATYQLSLLLGTEMDSAGSRETWRMETRYRLSPRCHGRYKVFRDHISVAEVEEIVVQNSTLSHTDYLTARKMDLIIKVFYDDDIFLDLMKYMKLRNLRVWEWLKIIFHRYSGHDRFGQFVSRFIAESENELWESKEALLERFGSSATVRRRVGRSEAGNAMQKYKGLSMTSYLVAVAEVACLACRDLLLRNGLQDDLGFLADLVRFNYLRMRNIFSLAPETYRESFHYDVALFSSESEPGGIELYRFPVAEEFTFAFSDEQQSMLAGYLELFGPSATGVSRILSRACISEFLRQPVRTRSFAPAKAPVVSIHSRRLPSPQVRRQDTVPD